MYGKSFQVEKSMCTSEINPQSRSRNYDKTHLKPWWAEVGAKKELHDVGDEEVGKVAGMHRLQKVGKFLGFSV